jgi:hypothetical protein
MTSHCRSVNLQLKNAVRASEIPEQLCQAELLWLGPGPHQGGECGKDKETAPALENLGSFSLYGVAERGCGVAQLGVWRSSTGGVA